MFRRKLKTKLPQVESLEENAFEGEMQNMDECSKHRDNLYVDEKFGAVKCHLEPDDSVFFKKKKQSKLKWTEIWKQLHCQTTRRSLVETE